MVLFTGCANEILKGEIDTAREKEQTLTNELEVARKYIENQDYQNADLLKQQAQIRRDSDTLLQELNQKNTELLAANTTLLTQNEELQNQLKINEEKSEMQNTSWQKTPSVTIIPNNSFSRTEISLSDTRLLPPHRQGENLVLELQDEFLFIYDTKNNILTLTAEGEKLLFDISQEILRCYPNNIYRIEGHTCYQNNIPSKNNHLDTTCQKAQLVAQYLLSHTTITPNQLEICGCGTSRPLVAETNDDNRRRNQRVEWIIRPERRIKIK